MIILRQKLRKAEGNSKKQKESCQEKLLADLALSASDQIHKQVDKSFGPKLDELLARKVKTSAMKNKPAKKDQKYKLQSNFSMFKKTKEQLKKMEPQKEDYSVGTVSTLSKFAKQNFGAFQRCFRRQYAQVGKALSLNEEKGNFAS